MALSVDVSVYNTQSTTQEDHHDDANKPGIAPISRRSVPRRFVPNKRINLELGPTSHPEQFLEA